MQITFYDRNGRPEARAPIPMVPEHVNEFFKTLITKDAMPQIHFAAKNLIDYYKHASLQDEWGTTVMQFDEKDYERYLEWAKDNVEDTPDMYWLKTMLDKRLDQWPFKTYTNTYHVSDDERLGKVTRKVFRYFPVRDDYTEPKFVEEHHRTIRRHIDHWIQDRLINGGPSDFLLRHRLDDGVVADALVSNLRRYNDSYCRLFNTTPKKVYPLFDAADPFNIQYWTKPQ